MEIYEAAIRHKEWVHYVELKDIFELHNLITAMETWGHVERKEISDDLIVFYFNNHPIARVVYKEE